MNKRTAAILIAIVVVIGGAFIGTNRYRAIDDKADEFSQGLVDRFGVFDFANREKVIYEGSKNQRIAVLTLNGTIGTEGSYMPGASNYANFLNQLDRAYEDPTVSAVLIRVNSPGGGVYASRIIRDKIQMIRHEKGMTVPVYVCMESMAASGGYYISAETDKIIASPDTLTGSIGVIMQSINYQGLMEKYGVKSEVFKSGAKKDILSPTREMTDDERAIMQELIDNSYARFLQVVSDGRNIPIEKLKPIADGRIYDGEQAKALGLVDELGSVEDALDMLIKDSKLEKAEVFSYESPSDFFSEFFGKFSAKSELSEILNLPKANSSLMYIYEGAL